VHIESDVLDYESNSKKVLVVWELCTFSDLIFHIIVERRLE